MYRGGGKSPAVVGRVERVAVVEGRCGGWDMPRGFLEPSGPSLEFMQALPQFSHRRPDGGPVQRGQLRPGEQLFHPDLVSYTYMV